MKYSDDYYYDDYDEVEYEELEEDNSNDGIVNTINIIAIISTWFIRFGMVVAVILFLYYIFTGHVLSALLFILGLGVAFLFGYFFMFLLDRFVED